MTDEQRLATIDDYISSFPAEAQVILEQIRQTIHRAVPDATETISYNIPTFDRGGRHLLFFAGWKRHVSVYPLPAGDAAFQERIVPYKEENSTLRLPLDQPIPFDVIEQLARFLAQEKGTGV